MQSSLPYHTRKSPKPSYEELMYMYENLDQECRGLKLQLASKQEVLERSIAQLDSTLSELDQAKITITSQENVIRDLTTKLQTLHKKDLDNFYPEPRKVENTEPENVGPVECETLNSLADVLPSFRGESLKGETSFREESIAKSLTKMDNASRQKWGSSGQAFRAALSHRAPNAQELAPACKITMAARAAKLRDQDDNKL